MAGGNQTTLKGIGVRIITLEISYDERGYPTAWPG